jgi:KTSC domain
MGPNMEPTPESSSVEEIGYDADAEEVWVRFRDSGGLYAYLGVPPVVWDDFRGSASKGGFVNDVLKRTYPFRRV